MVEVLGLGDAGVDIILHVPHLPQHDEKVLATKVERHTGGVIANFLCTLSRLGTSSGFVGCLGDDELGRIVQKGLAGFGVDLSRLLVKAGQETYFCVTLLDETGEKALTIGLTDTIFPAPADITPEMIDQARLLHSTGLNANTTLRALCFARQKGMTTSLDLEPSTLSQGIAPVREVLRDIDLLFINQHAVQELFPGVAPAAAGRQLLGWGPHLVVETRGAEGSILVTPHQTLQTPAFAVPVVDTTGAGDCFNAAFVHGYLKGWPLDRTALFANAAAAISITAVGAQSALPTTGQVEELIASQQERKSHVREHV